MNDEELIEALEKTLNMDLEYMQAMTIKVNILEAIVTLNGVVAKPVAKNQIVNQIFIKFQGQVKLTDINQGVDDFMNDLVTEQLVTIDNNKYTPTLEGTMIGNMKLAMQDAKHNVALQNN